jgi:hypothetical protein
MIKKQQKWIALLVVCTFLWLMQVSTMPVAAAGTTEQIGSAGAEQGPDYYEAVSQKAAPAKKKSILPIILIGVGLVAVTAAVLFLVVLKNYNILGTWKVDYTNAPPITSFNITFSGTKKSGTWSLAVYTDKGTYTVDGKDVTFVFNNAQWIFTGKFDGKDKITGTHAWAALGISGTWTATRLSTASAVNPNLQATEGSIIEKMRNK